MEISRILTSTSTKNWNRRFVANNDGIAYENLTFTTSANVTAFGNGTSMVDLEKIAATDGAWDAQAYTATGWAAPFTVEWVSLFNTTDNGQSYNMLSLNTDPTTDANYTSLDYSAYSSYSPLVVYHNGSSTATGVAVSPLSKFYITYAVNGYIYIYNGSTLAYSVDTGSSTTLRYIDSSIYNIGHGFRRVRGIKKQWNGQAYV